MGVAFAEQVSVVIPEGDLLTPTRLAGTKWLPPGYPGGRTHTVPISGEGGERPETVNDKKSLRSDHSVESMTGQ